MKASQNRPAPVATIAPKPAPLAPSNATPVPRAAPAAPSQPWLLEHVRSSASPAEKRLEPGYGDVVAKSTPSKSEAHSAHLAPHVNVASSVQPLRTNAPLLKRSAQPANAPALAVVGTHALVASPTAHHTEPHALVVSPTAHHAATATQPVARHPAPRASVPRELPTHSTKAPLAKVNGGTPAVAPRATPAAPPAAPHAQSKATARVATGKAAAMQAGGLAPRTATPPPSVGRAQGARHQSHGAATAARMPAAATSRGAAATPSRQAVTQAGTGNAYADVLAAPPSRQAHGLWTSAGGKATAQAAADQSSFHTAFRPTANEASAGDSATPGQHGINAKRVQDARPSSRQAKPATPRSHTPKPAGSAPVPLTALSARAELSVASDHQSGAGELATALVAEQAKVACSADAAQLQPVELQASITLPPMQVVPAMPELPAISGMQKLKSWNLPADVHASFDAVARPMMEGHQVEAQAKMTQAQAKRDVDRDKAVADVQHKVQQAHVDADQHQNAALAESHTQLAHRQSETLARQDIEIKKLDAQSSDRKDGAISKINKRIQADHIKIESDYATAQRQAADKQQQGAAYAEQKQKDVDNQANSPSLWGRAVGTVRDAIASITAEVDKALATLHATITALFDAVHAAACKLIDAANDFVDAELTAFGDWMKLATTSLIGSVLPGLAAELNRLIDAAINHAKQEVKAIDNKLKTTVTAFCNDLKAAVDAAIAVFKAAVHTALTFAQAALTGDWSLVAKMVLEGILRLLGIEPVAFYALIGSAKNSLETILDNPRAFVGHLVDAVKLGFKQFGGNFLGYLQNGMVQWLFGALPQTGITMPASFNVAGVFDLVCQVLGLNWPRLRGKVVKLIGEKNTERLEFVAGYVQTLVTGGFAGLWEKVQQDLSGLWETVIGGVKGWLMEKVVQQAIVKIAMIWNPAGAVIQLIQTAWSVYQWVKENAQRIFGLVQSVVGSIANIVAGNIGGAANLIEGSLAKMVPVAISLCANVLGLGGIGEKVKMFIEKIQSKVDQAIDKLIERLILLFKERGSKNKAKTSQIGARVSFVANGDKHTQYIDISRGAPIAMVASTPTSVKACIGGWRTQLRRLQREQRKSAGSLIAKAIATERALERLAIDAKKAPDHNDSQKLLEEKQRELGDILSKLFELMSDAHNTQLYFKASSTEMVPWIPRDEQGRPWRGDIPGNARIRGLDPDGSGREVFLPASSWFEYQVRTTYGHKKSSRINIKPTFFPGETGIQRSVQPDLVSAARDLYGDAKMRDPHFFRFIDNAVGSIEKLIAASDADGGTSDSILTLITSQPIPRRIHNEIIRRLVFSLRSRGFKPKQIMDILSRIAFGRLRPAMPLRSED